MMPEEVFDIVDEADVVIGRAPRSEVHRSRWRHRAVHILVSNRAGEFYLQRRAPWKDCAPDLWDTSAAGHVASGEDYLTAAQRELAEELGVDPANPLTPVTKFAATAATGYEFVTVFRVQIETPVHPDPQEIVDGRWCSRAEIDRWLARAPADFTGTFKQIWQYLGGPSAPV